MARIIAVANQKGGVAKTTTVASLGVALAELGQRVLLVDLDPQGCLTYSLGLDPETLELSVYEVLLGKVSIGMAIQKTADGPDILPATIELSGGEAELLARIGREHALRTALDDVVDDYDIVLIDCPPSLSVLTINGLTAAGEVLIPLQCEALSHRGVGQLLDTVDLVRRLSNPRLTVLGVLPTMFDGRTNHAREVLGDITSRYQLPVLDPPISKSIRFAEAPSTGRSVMSSFRRVGGVQSYRVHAATIAGVPIAPDGDNGDPTAIAVAQ